MDRPNSRVEYYLSILNAEYDWQDQEDMKQIVNRIMDDDLCMEEVKDRLRTNIPTFKEVRKLLYALL